MTRKGFTLIELLVVIVIIGILVAIALPNFIRIKDKAKEAEVKQNLHAVQLALERYAVDAPAGDYPLFPMGGDWTDSYVVWEEWVDLQPELDPDDIEKYQVSGEEWVAAPTDRGDALVMEAYMPSYPGNPFIKTKSSTILPYVEHYSWHDVIWQRFVGGRQSDKMVEIFGWTWTSGAIQRPTGDYYVHHIFNNPPYLISDKYKETTASGPVDYNSPSGNSILVGNFSYYARPTSENGIWSSQQREDCMGYTLAGYGSVRTPGQDVYNRNGNYKGRYRTINCEVDCSGISDWCPDDIPCICPPDNSAPSHVKNNGGSDTLADGVIVTLDSGVDKKTGRVNFGVTEGE
jgi:prepilin-type N-terminal cleavage/methylation domain-containing protein